MVFIAPGNPQPLDGHLSHNHNVGIVELRSAALDLDPHRSNATIYILLQLRNIVGPKNRSNFKVQVADFHDCKCTFETALYIIEK